MKFNHEERRAGHTRRKNANNSTCSTPKTGNNDKYWINVNSSLLDEEVELESVRSIIPADYLICSPLQLDISLPSSTSSSASSIVPFPPNFSPRKRPKSAAASPRKRFFRQISPSGQVETFETCESRNDDETDNYDDNYDYDDEDDEDDNNTHGFMTIKAYAANLRIQEQLEKDRSLPCLSPKKKQGNGKSPKEELLEEERQQQLQLTMMQYAETDDEMSTIHPEERSSSRSVIRSRSVISILASIIPKGKCAENENEEEEDENDDDDNTVVIATGRGDDETGGGSDTNESNNNTDTNANANANAMLCNSLSTDRSLRCFTDADDIDGDIETCQIEVVAVKDDREESRSGRNNGVFSSLWRRGRTRLQLITTSTKKKKKAGKRMDEHEENGDETHDVEQGTVTDEENNNNTNTNTNNTHTKNDDYNKSVTDPKNNNSTINKRKDEDEDEDNVHNDTDNDNIDDKKFQATSEERAAVKKLIEADGDPTTQHLVDNDTDNDNDNEENEEKNHNEEENVSQSLYIALLLFLVIVLLSWVLYYVSSGTPATIAPTPTPTTIPSNNDPTISVSSQLLYTDTNVFRRRSDGLF